MAEKEAAKLGPSATYIGNFEGDRQSVTMAGVFFRPGKSVNLVDELGEQRAKSMLAKLAGNTFFKVDGGPDHRAAQEKRQQALDEADEYRQEEAEDDRISRIAAPEAPTLERQPQANEGKAGRKQAT